MSCHLQLSAGACPTVATNGQCKEISLSVKRSFLKGYSWKCYGTPKEMQLETYSLASQKELLLQSAYRRGLNVYGATLWRLLSNLFLNMPSSGWHRNNATRTTVSGRIVDSTGAHFVVFSQFILFINFGQQFTVFMAPTRGSQVIFSRYMRSLHAASCRKVSDKISYKGTITL